MTDIPAMTLPAPVGIDVSVVIPVYNCEKYIPETIESVRAQDMRAGAVEIIAVDDGSTDNSLSMLNELATDSNDLHVYSIPNSGSAAAPRNFGLEQARGRYVFFLDADDKFSPNALSRLTEVADSTGSGVVLGKMGLFGKKRAGNVPSTAFGKTLFAVDFIDSKAHSTLGAWKLFRRSILIDNDIRFPLGYKIGEDQPFTMKAYLHSPHISILADRVYYWLRGRDDGTNITATGQPPRKHLSRILTLIKTIVDNTEPGERRDRLLRRPIIGAAGVKSVFGKKMLSSHSRAERETMLKEFRDVVAPLWNPSIRDHGLPESQILVDLALRNDIDGVEAVSRFLKEKKPVPLALDDDRTQLVYEPRAGSSVGDLQIRLHQTLETITATTDVITVRGEFGIDGLDEAPDSAQIIFRHRKLGTKVVSKLDASRTYTRSFGTRARFSTDIRVARLADSGIWEVFIKAKWSSVVARERFGKSRAPGLDISPLLVDDPIKAVVFIDNSDELAIDVGPTERHLDPVKRLELHVVDQFEVGRSTVVLINGPVSTMQAASYRADITAKEKPAKLIVHSTDQASVVIPRSAAKKQSCTIELKDAEGNPVEIALTELRD
ncbi:glycosyltransferase family 2 protein [Brevibacterium sp. CFH 10365]|uniref:glycosyltransferase family 2 protein n=1 Tax=Brevibacterium sp. CFH 10365 TaxID=2585207 RepID=UPI00126634E2|nr:glycosyltransferase family 2 protein [Brevibacterium sp. CFH 10365]